MDEHKYESSCLFTSEELATHIVDTLVDHGFIDKVHFKAAVASVKWELDAQHGMGRIILNAEADSETGDGEKGQRKGSEKGTA